MTTKTPTTYAEVIEEVTEGLIWDNSRQDYIVEREALTAGIWGTSDSSYELDGKTYINGDEVAEEIQRRAVELGIEG